MPILNLSSLGVGSLTNICFHSQTSANDNIISYVSYNYIPFNNNNLLNYHRKSVISRYPLHAAPVNSQIDENLDGSTLSLEPPRSIRVSFISALIFVSLFEDIL